MSAVALKALRKELLLGTTVGQNRRTYQGPVAVGDKDSVLSQGEPPSGVKKQVPSIRDIAVQVDQPKHAPINVPLRQLSGTPSVKTTAMQTDIPQRSSMTPRTNDPQQTKDENRKEHLQAPKEALNASPYNQQLIT